MFPLLKGSPFNVLTSPKRAPDWVTLLSTILQCNHGRILGTCLSDGIASQYILDGQIDLLNYLAFKCCNLLFLKCAK